MHTNPNGRITMWRHQCVARKKKLGQFGKVYSLTRSSRMNFDIGKGRRIMVSPEATCEIVIGLAVTMALVADAVLMCGIPGCSVIEPH